MEDVIISEQQLKARKTTLLKKSVEELVDIVLKKDDNDRKFNNRIVKLKDNIRGLENKIKNMSSTSSTGGGEPQGEHSDATRIKELENLVADLNTENAEMCKANKGYEDQVAQLKETIVKWDEEYTKEIHRAEKYLQAFKRSRSAFKTSLVIILGELILVILLLVF